MAGLGQPFEIRERILILCEGPHDRAFLRALMAHHKIDGFQTTDPYHLGENRGGHTYWRSALQRIVGAPDAENLTGLIIFGDNDDTPEDRVNSIRNALTDTPPIPATSVQLPVPDAADVIAPGPPGVMILMVPGAGRTGVLETLWLEAARRVAPPEVLACIDSYKACGQWGAAQRAPKAEMRALISCLNARDPEISFAKIWDRCPGVVPIDDHAFIPIADRLRAFRDAI